MGREQARQTWAHRVLGIWPSTEPKLLGRCVSGRHHYMKHRSTGRLTSYRVFLGLDHELCVQGSRRSDRDVLRGSHRRRLLCRRSWPDAGTDTHRRPSQFCRQLGPKEPSGLRLQQGTGGAVAMNDGAQGAGPGRGDYGAGRDYSRYADGGRNHSPRGQWGDDGYTAYGKGQHRGSSLTGGGRGYGWKNDGGDGCGFDGPSGTFVEGGLRSKFLPAWAVLCQPRRKGGGRRPPPP